MKELVQSFYTEDGCKAEKRIFKNSIGDGHGETITEIHAEKPMPKYLKQRVIEREAPVVVEREVQVFDENGEMTSQKEVVEHQLKLYEVQRQAPKAMAQGMDQNSLLDKVEQVVAKAVQPIQEEINEIKSAMKQEVCKPMVSVQSLIGEKLEGEKKVNLTGWDMVGIAIIIAQIGAVGYFAFFF